jgi:GNAT superfamily N-acetyltransferase
MIQIKPTDSADRAWIVALLKEEWGSQLVAAHGCLIDAGELPGFVAWIDGERVGLATYQFEHGACEIVSLNSHVIGTGQPLIEAVKGIAIEQGYRRLWLITTNDNLSALRFYQRIGFRLKAVYPNALEVSRKLKPSIPMIGIGGIPIRDEIELEMAL